MAILLSEDKEVKSSFEIIFVKEQIEKRELISWIPYQILLKSGNKDFIYKKDSNCRGAGDYVLALNPANEIDILINGINNFLKSKEKKMFSFEPLEPSFELILERSEKGYSLISWLDSGNVISDHYSWDGFGIRFFTTEEKIKSFAEELESEREALSLKGGC